MISTNVGDGLVFVDQNLVAQPIVAESWKTPDDTTWIFNLREGVKFHNGREMVAEDVVFSLNRLMDTEGTSYWGRKMKAAGTTVEALGQYQIKLTTPEPYGAMMTLLGHMMASIVPSVESASGEIDLEKEFFSVGPFKVTEHIEESLWKLEAHEEYWERELLGKNSPRIKNLEWRIIPDNATRVAALRTGEVQIIFPEDPKMLDTVGKDENITGIQQLTTNYYHMPIIASRPNLGDVRVRRALQLATDREALAQIAAYGYAVPTGPISAGFQTLATPFTDLPGYVHDPVEAKRLLKEAGVEGLEIEINVTPYIPMTINLAQVVKEQWKKAGITANVMVREQQTWLDYLLNAKTDTSISWWVGYTDPAFNFVRDKKQLMTRYGLAEEAAEELAVKGDLLIQEPDPQKRMELYREVEKLWAEEAFTSMLISRNNFIAYRNDMITNIKLQEFGEGYGVPLWQGMKVVEMIR
jgi:peptide/nickel transport system substrate-binding protein